MQSGIDEGAYHPDDKSWETEGEGDSSGDAEVSLKAHKI